MSYDPDMTIREYEQQKRDREIELELLGRRMEREDRQGMYMSRDEFRREFGREKPSRDDWSNPYG